MKKLIIFAALITALFVQNSSAQAVKSTRLSPLLQSYYDIKNALIKSDAVTAAAKAGDFYTKLSAIDPKDLSKEESAVFGSLRENLTADSKAIAESKDPGKQRQLFSGFSVNVYKLAKGVKLSDEPIYYAYCPMKKSYWLSNEPAIKNPYYGKQMLTCGTNAETIK